MELEKWFDLEYVLELLTELLAKRPNYYGPRIAIIEEVVSYERDYQRPLRDDSFYKSLAMSICDTIAPEARLVNAE